MAAPTLRWVPHITQQRPTWRRLVCSLAAMACRFRCALVCTHRVGLSRYIARFRPCARLHSMRKWACGSSHSSCSPPAMLRCTPLGTRIALHRGTVARCLARCPCQLRLPRGHRIASTGRPTGKHALGLSMAIKMPVRHLRAPHRLRSECTASSSLARSASYPLMWKRRGPTFEGWPVGGIRHHCLAHCGIRLRSGGESTDTPTCR